MSAITVGSIRFATKADAERHIRAILETHRPQFGTKELSPGARAFVLDLLELHPHREIVVGSGIDKILCQLIENGALRFLIQRTDGTMWDVSWRGCLTPPTPLKRLLAVLRSEVQYQIDDFRDSLIFPQDCPFTAEVIYRKNCHIDHATPETFAVIAADWLRITGYSEESIELLHKSEYGGRATIKDRVIAAQWQTFHKSRARLRAVSQKANLSVLRRGL